MQQLPIVVPSQGQSTQICDAPDQRRAPRFTLLIRTAKLHINGRQHLCLLRDVSMTGTSIRTFFPLAENESFAIEFDTGETVGAALVWQKGNAAGFQFEAEINVDDVTLGVARHRKRDLRFDVDHPIEIHTRGHSYAATLCNLSRQGGRISTDAAFALDQPLRITGLVETELEARVRWRSDGSYGVVLDTTFTLEQLADVLRILPARRDRVELD